MDTDSWEDGEKSRSREGDKPGDETARLLSPVARWLAAGSVLLLEYLVISFSFDAWALRRIHGFGSVLGHLGEVGPVAVLVAAALVGLRGSQLRAELRRVTDAVEPVAWPWPWVLLHGLAYLGFLGLTQELFRIVKDGQTPSVWWIVGWSAAAVVVVLSLLPLVLAPRALWLLVRRGSRAILVGVAAGIAAWLAGQVTARFWGPLGESTLDLVVLLLRPFTAEVIVDRSRALLGIEPFFVHMAPVCSGFEGMGLIAVLLGAYIAISRSTLRFPQVLLLLPAAVGAAWCLNAVRIAALVAIGAWWSPALALNAFHSKAGWVFFSAIALASMVLIRRSPLFSRDAAPRDDSSWNPTAAYVMPWLAMLAAAMVTGLFSLQLDLLYGVRIAAALTALWLYRKRFQPVSWSWSWQAAGIGVVGFACWIALVSAGDAVEARAQIAALPLPAAILWIAVRLVGSVAVVPVVEELAFRGYLLRRLISADFTEVDKKRFSWLSFLVSSIAFGLSHRHYLAGAVAGMLYALAQRRRGRTGDAIVAHAVTNALVAADVLVLGRWDLWS